MSDSSDPTPRRRHVRRAVVVGALAAVVCAMLPAEHRELCHTIANVCTGGLIP